jgi:hypothetical protein
MVKRCRRKKASPTSETPAAGLSGDDATIKGLRVSRVPNLSGSGSISQSNLGGIYSAGSGDNSGGDPDRIGNGSGRMEGVMDATRRIDPAQLPQLQVAIFKGEELVRVVELKDPRSDFCRFFNSLEVGEQAYPVSRAMTLARSKRRAE